MPHLKKIENVTLQISEILISKFQLFFEHSSYVYKGVLNIFNINQIKTLGVN